jgi:hypothetical protein
MNGMRDPPLKLSKDLAAGIGLTIFVKYKTIFVIHQTMSLRQISIKI